MEEQKKEANKLPPPGTFPNRLDHLIRHRGLQKSQLAKELGIGSTTLSLYISGRRPVPDDRRIMFARILKRDIDDIFPLPEENIATLHDSPPNTPLCQKMPSRPSDQPPPKNSLSEMQTYDTTLEHETYLEKHDMKYSRRHFLEQTFQLLGTTAIDHTSLLPTNSWERLAKVLQRPSDIDEQTLNHFETIIGNYWQLFYNTTTQNLLHGTLGLLQTLTTLLENPYPTHHYQRLCALTSKTTLLAGRIALDQDHHAAVNRYYRLALQAAQKSGDAALYAVSLACMASVFIENNQPQQAIPLFQEARRQCPNSDNTMIAVWLAIHEAEAWAMMTQDTPCLKALEIAEDNAQQITSYSDPYWTNFDRSLLFGFRGVCYLKLQKPQSAYQALQEALTLTTMSNRQTGIYFSDIAATFVQRAAPEEACAMLGKALGLATQTQSAMLMERLLNVLRDLEPWKHEQCVQDLNDQLALAKQNF